MPVQPQIDIKSEKAKSDLKSSSKEIASNVDDAAFGVGASAAGLGAASYAAGRNADTLVEGAKIVSDDEMTKLKDFADTQNIDNPIQFVNEYAKKGSEVANGKFGSPLINGGVSGRTAIDQIRGGTVNTLSKPFVDEETAQTMDYDLGSQKHYDSFKKGPLSAFSVIAEDLDRSDPWKNFKKDVEGARAKALADMNPDSPYGFDKEEFNKRFGEELDKRFSDPGVRYTSTMQESKNLAKDINEHLAHNDKSPTGSGAIEEGFNAETTEEARKAIREDTKILFPGESNPGRSAFSANMQNFVRKAQDLGYDVDNVRQVQNLPREDKVEILDAPTKDVGNNPSASASELFQRYNALKGNSTTRDFADNYKSEAIDPLEDYRKQVSEAKPFITKEIAPRASSAGKGLMLGGGLLAAGVGANELRERMNKQSMKKEADDYLEEAGGGLIGGGALLGAGGVGASYRSENLRQEGDFAADRTKETRNNPSLSQSEFRDIARSEGYKGTIEVNPQTHSGNFGMPPRAEGTEMADSEKLKIDVRPQEDIGPREVSADTKVPRSIALHELGHYKSFQGSDTPATIESYHEGNRTKDPGILDDIMNYGERHPQYQEEARAWDNAEEILRNQEGEDFTEGEKSIRRNSLDNYKNYIKSNQLKRLGSAGRQVGLGAAALGGGVLAADSIFDAGKKYTDVSMNKTSDLSKNAGGPGSGVEHDNTAKIMRLEKSPDITIHRREKIKAQREPDREKKVKISDIDYGAQSKYNIEKLGWFLDNWSEWKDSPIDVALMDGEYHLMDGHHRYLAADRLRKNTLPANIWIVSKDEVDQIVKSAEKSHNFEVGQEFYSHANDEHIIIKDVSGNMATVSAEGNSWKEPFDVMQYKIENGHWENVSKKEAHIYKLGEPDLNQDDNDLGTGSKVLYTGAGAAGAGGGYNFLQAANYADKAQRARSEYLDLASKDPSQPGGLSRIDLEDARQLAEEEGFTGDIRNSPMKSTGDSLIKPDNGDVTIVSGGAKNEAVTPTLMHELGHYKNFQESDYDNFETYIKNNNDIKGSDSGIISDIMGSNQTSPLVREEERAWRRASDIAERHGLSETMDPLAKRNATDTYRKAQEVGRYGRNTGRLGALALGLGAAGYAAQESDMLNKQSSLGNKSQVSLSTLGKPVLNKEAARSLSDLERDGDWVKYRGTWYPLDKPVESWRKGKKRAVLASKEEDGEKKVKLVHYGSSDHEHNYSDKAKQNYLSRAKGITNQKGEKTKDDPHSANHWSIKDLWPEDQDADGSEKFDAHTPDDNSRFMSDKTAADERSLNSTLDDSLEKSAVGNETLYRIRDAAQKEISQNSNSNSNFDPKRDRISLRNYLGGYVDQQGGDPGLSEHKIYKQDSVNTKPLLKNPENIEGSNVKGTGIQKGDAKSLVDTIENKESIWTTEHPEIAADYAVDKIPADQRPVNNWNTRSSLGIISEFDAESNQLKTTRSTPRISTDPFDSPKKWQAKLQQFAENRKSEANAKEQTHESVVKSTSDDASDVVKNFRLLGGGEIGQPKSKSEIKSIVNNLTKEERGGKNFMDTNINKDHARYDASTPMSHRSQGRYALGHERSSFLDISGGFKGMDNTAKNLAESSGSMFKKLSYAKPNVSINKEADLKKNEQMAAGASATGAGLGVFGEYADRNNNFDLVTDKGRRDLRSFGHVGNIEDSRKMMTEYGRRGSKILGGDEFINPITGGQVKGKDMIRPLNSEMSRNISNQIDNIDQRVENMRPSLPDDDATNNFLDRARDKVDFNVGSTSQRAHYEEFAKGPINGLAQYYGESGGSPQRELDQVLNDRRAAAASGANDTEEFLSNYQDELKTHFSNKGTTISDGEARKMAEQAEGAVQDVSDSYSAGDVAGQELSEEQLKQQAEDVKRNVLGEDYSTLGGRDAKMRNQIAKAQEMGYNVSSASDIERLSNADQLEILRSRQGPSRDLFQRVTDARMAGTARGASRQYDDMLGTGLDTARRNSGMITKGLKRGGGALALGGLAAIPTMRYMDQEEAVNQEKTGSSNSRIIVDKENPGRVHRMFAQSDSEPIDDKDEYKSRASEAFEREYGTQPENVKTETYYGSGSALASRTDPISNLPEDQQREAISGYKSDVYVDRGLPGGMMIGGIAGGLAPLGGGKTRVATTALGSMLGGAAGAEISRSMAPSPQDVDVDEYLRRHDRSSISKESKNKNNRFSRTINMVGRLPKRANDTSLPDGIDAPETEVNFDTGEIGENMSFDMDMPDIEMPDDANVDMPEPAYTVTPGTDPNDANENPVSADLQNVKQNPA
jgi:hypothetical protein